MSSAKNKISIPPELTIIAGPNGCGKSTLAEILQSKQLIHYFINADTIAKGIGNTPKSDIEAGRILLERISKLLTDGGDIAFESTMAGRGWINHIRNAKHLGYRVCIYYVILSDVSLAIERVKERVRKGGHGIPENVIRRRFDRSLRLFSSVYHPLVDQWTIFDNSNSTLKIVASSLDGEVQINDKDLFSRYFPRGLT